MWLWHHWCHHLMSECGWCHLVVSRQTKPYHLQYEDESCSLSCRSWWGYRNNRSSLYIDDYGRRTNWPHPSLSFSWQRWRWQPAICGGTRRTYPYDHQGSCFSLAVCLCLSVSVSLHHQHTPNIHLPCKHTNKNTSTTSFNKKHVA